MNKEELRLLEVVLDTSVKYPQTHVALINSKKVVKGRRTPKEYSNLFYRNDPEQDDSLILFEGCDTPLDSIKGIGFGLIYDNNKCLFKIQLANGKYLLYNMDRASNGNEFMLCCIYDSSKNIFADCIVAAAPLFGCNYIIETKSQFCLDRALSASRHHAARVWWCW